MSGSTEAKVLLEKISRHIDVAQKLCRTIGCLPNSLMTVDLIKREMGKRLAAFLVDEA